MEVPCCRVKEEGRIGGSELGSDLDLDPDPQHWFQTV